MRLASAGRGAGGGDRDGQRAGAHDRREDEVAQRRDVDDVDEHRPLLGVLVDADVRVGVVGARDDDERALEVAHAGVLAPLPGDRALARQLLELGHRGRRDERHVAVAGEQPLDLLEADLPAADDEAAPALQLQARDVERRVEHVPHAGLVADPAAELADALLPGVGGGRHHGEGNVSLWMLRSSRKGWEPLFWSVFEKSRNAMALLDGRRIHGRSTRRRLDLFGYPREQLLGMALDDLYPPTDRPLLVMRWDQLVSRGAAIVGHRELRARRRHPSHRGRGRGPHRDRHRRPARALRGAALGEAADAHPEPRASGRRRADAARARGRPPARARPDGPEVAERADHLPRHRAHARAQRDGEGRRADPRAQLVAIALGRGPDRTPALVTKITQLRYGAKTLGVNSECADGVARENGRRRRRMASRTRFPTRPLARACPGSTLSRSSICARASTMREELLLRMVSSTGEVIPPGSVPPASGTDGSDHPARPARRPRRGVCRRARTAGCREPLGVARCATPIRSRPSSAP